MTKRELIRAIADRGGPSRRDAGKAVDSFLETVTGVPRSGDSVTFTGFGKFSGASRAARVGVTPRRVRRSTSRSRSFRSSPRAANEAGSLHRITREADAARKRVGQ